MDGARCRDAHTEEVYRHPLVEGIVRRLGGRAALITENAAADRARLIEAYDVILGAEQKEAGRLPEVAKWLEEQGGGRVVKSKLQVQDVVLYGW